ncbi:hypothetical protein C41B8_05473 [Salinisphaera hydrothermalis C41B8]|uniref:Putative phage metallopeptidase domain-containing protein n=2 Tax=Salinisphaera TaxID=180541 RepID=A0A084INP2_SALHC|nr:hypothetical protein C41B8_05473 [Salinisphaera hydrothermalis C41B8]
MPPARLIDPDAPAFDANISFAPDPMLAEWARATFIVEGGPLFNEEHVHLEFASIGFLWAGALNRKKGRVVLGQAETCPPSVPGGKWLKERINQQLLEWFDEMPAFLITLDAHYCAQCSDLEFCALVEHELLHCAQAEDENGAPKFTQEGMPKFTIRGHDVEEFTSVVRRYGPPDQATAEFVAAASSEPTVGRASVARACGNCLKVA